MRTNKQTLTNQLVTEMREFEAGRLLMLDDSFYSMPEDKQYEVVVRNSNHNKEIYRLKKELELVEAENRALKINMAHDGHLWLGDVLEIEKPQFSTNNLIKSPVGSGKSYVILNQLSEDYGKLQLLLVSNTFLKDSNAPDITGDEKRMMDAANVFTTANKASYGDNKVKFWVMTYAEFGNRILKNNKFIEDNNIDVVWSDEIHSLFEYMKYSRDMALGVAAKYLFEVTPGVDKYYFTATDERLRQAGDEWFENVTSFDYREYPGIRKYTAKAEYTYSHIDQLSVHLEARTKDWKNYGYKGLFYASKITTLKRMEEMLIGMGFNPLVFWSKNNTDYEMTDEQLSALDKLTVTGVIPEGYDFLLINSSMREGWNLKDPKVDLVIVHSISETDQIQARGRARRNISTLITLVNEPVVVQTKIKVPNEYLGKSLTSDNIKELLEDVSVINANGVISGWRAVKDMIEVSGYTITTSRKTVNGKKLTINTIDKI